MITAEDYIYQLRTRDGKPCRVLENFFLRGESEKLEEIIGQDGVSVLTKRFIHNKEVDEFLAKIKAKRDEAETNNKPPNAKAKGRGRTKLGENRPKRNPASP